MDNNEFDKIFEQGLSETQSFSGAEESWQKLQPRLHPPRKRRRFILWPFLLAAAVFFGITTYWFYNQSANLKEDMAALTEQLQQQEKTKEITPVENASENVLPKTEVKAQTTDQQNTNLETTNNKIPNKPINDNIENEFINIKKSESIIPQAPKSNPINTQSPTPLSNLSPQEDIAATDINIDNKITTEIKEIIKNEKVNIQNKSQIQQSMAAFAKLINKFWLLDYEREEPTLALLENPQTSPLNEQEELKQKRGFSLGINGGLARNASFGNNAADITLFQSPTASDGRPNNFTFDQYGVHANYTLNNNWQLHSSINRERAKIFYETVVTSSVFDLNNLEIEENITPGLGSADGEVFASYVRNNYSKTEVAQRNWLFNLGIRRRLFSIKKLDAYLGTYATLRIFQKQAIRYSGLKAQNGNNANFDSDLLATASGSTDFAITPAFGFGSPIGQHFYWNLEARYNFHLSSQSSFQIPEAGATLGVGYKF